jgi:hypothetical protein
MGKTTKTTLVVLDNTVLTNFGLLVGQTWLQSGGQAGRAVHRKSWQNTAPAFKPWGWRWMPGAIFR